MEYEIEFYVERDGWEIELLVTGACTPEVPDDYGSPLHSDMGTPGADAFAEIHSVRVMGGDYPRSVAANLTEPGDLTAAEQEEVTTKLLEAMADDAIPYSDF